MSKNLVIPTTPRKDKKAQVDSFEKEWGGSHSKGRAYRFTAVLPENVGQKLRLHCAHHNLKLKHVVAEAVEDFLNRQEETSQE